MNQFNRIEVADCLTSIGLVPLFYHGDTEVSKNILKACYDGGARAVEYTARGLGAHDVFKELVAYAQHELPGMLLGIGSVTDAFSAALYMQLGASFVVTPVLREDIARVCNRRKVLWIPGCGSLKEIAASEELGCEIIKLFPGASYGPDFVKAIKGPQPWTSIMPTGGVTTSPSNLRAWIHAGVCCVGIGTNLIASGFNDVYNYDEIRRNVQQTIAHITEIRKEI